MAREIIIPHGEIMDSQKITQVQEAYMQAHDIKPGVHEVVNLEDDFGKKVRRLRIKNTRYFDMGRRV